ncbi:MarR family winged helix-turn-helix transcriptional regulator [Ralstonia solanacearum]|uniref:Organic hydroperoxide resistance transcriptional regulator, marr family n=1 Tax=Ralstonia solanacearum (strain Po82) TaxID=1031711 RepID=F6G6U9_RALS8|nr:MarR family transcriptional regulator [Ralstonia solanacearum]AEG67644.1 organic hydroperoxide resistance transcriptional regulator, marr family [Ralstonia solanacearum Po82]AMP69013.1 MarR family transcriptional regulator [Ralstonia solanacearum]AMP74080.1 MarR family transcriptional regulator [Ralstonia solanacearum]AYB59384.1 MarR family transcriptional regulator [Ralstonia solanacearum]EUJ16274.1 MarR family transcriptional regulator [Ralstonia solanacearum P673]
MSTEVQTPPEATDQGAYQLDTMDRDTNVGRLVHRARHELVTHIDAALATLDLTAAQWTVVVYLAEDLANTPAELSRLLNYDPGAMTRLIDRLEKKNIVKRAPSDADRRSVVVTLTEQGRTLYPEIRPLIVDVLNHLLRGFSQVEVKQLENLLLRVLHNA